MQTRFNVSNRLLDPFFKEYPRGKLKGCLEKVQYFPSSAKYEKFDLISIYFNHEV